MLLPPLTLLLLERGREGSTSVAGSISILLWPSSCPLATRTCRGPPAGTTVCGGPILLLSCWCWCSNNCCPTSCCGIIISSSASMAWVMAGGWAGGRGSDGGAAGAALSSRGCTARSPSRSRCSASSSVSSSSLLRLVALLVTGTFRRLMRATFLCGLWRQSNEAWVLGSACVRG